MIVLPKWTLQYNNPGDFTGLGWEFYTLEATTDARKAVLEGQGRTVTKRPFHKTDIRYLAPAPRAVILASLADLLDDIFTALPDTTTLLLDVGETPRNDHIGRLMQIRSLFQ